MGVSGVFDFISLVFMVEECILVIVKGWGVMMFFENLFDEDEIVVVVKYIFEFKKD